MLNHIFSLHNPKEGHQMALLHIVILISLSEYTQKVFNCGRSGVIITVALHLFGAV